LGFTSLRVHMHTVARERTNANDPNEILTFDRTRRSIRTNECQARSQNLNNRPPAAPPKGPNVVGRQMPERSGLAVRFLVPSLPR
jgi:hypothetical protein